jgi:hypothetical protein
MMEIITGHRDYPYVAGTSSDDFVKLVRKFPFTFKDGGPETMQHFTFAF